MDITQQKETNDDEEATSVKVRSFCRNFYNLFRLVRLLSNLDRMSCNFCPLLPPSGLSESFKVSDRLGEGGTKDDPGEKRQE